MRTVGVAKATDDGPSVEDLADLADYWQVSLRAARRAPATLMAYERGVAQYLAYCRANGIEHPIHRRALDGWMAALAQKGMSGNSARSRLTAVRQFTKWLLAEDEIPFNPFTDMAQPALDEQVTEPLSPDQIKAMMATCDPKPTATPERRFLDIRDAAILQVMIETGLRAGEVCGLARDDVRWKDNPATVTVRKSKTRRARSAPISPQAAQRVGKYERAARIRRERETTDAFWLSARGGPLRYPGLYDALAKRAVEAGIEGFHPHQLRHTAAHRWLKAGGSESGLMAVAGWQSPQMLHRYTKAQAEARAAEEAQRLNLGEL